MYVDYIKEQAKAKKLTVKDLAILTNTSESTISNYFSRKTESPSFEMVTKLCIALGISIDEMVGIKQPTEKKEEPNFKELLTSLTDSFKSQIETYKTQIEVYKSQIDDYKKDKESFAKDKKWLYIIIFVSISFLFLLGMF